MAGLPGSIQSLMPAGPDEQVRRMRDLERRQDEMGPSVARSFKPVIDDLAAKQATLEAQQAALAATDAALTTAQATLEAQQAALTDLVARVVVPAAFNHTETGFDPVAGTWATVSSVTLTVPAGFTQAVVTAIAYAGITSAGGDIHCRATVAGVGGPADTRSTSADQWRPVLSMFSHRVTGLTGGGTVAVACQAYVATDVGADAANTATVSGTVLWLR